MYKYLCGFIVSFSITLMVVLHAAGFWKLQTITTVSGACISGNDSNTVLLIHSNTTDASTTFTDSGQGTGCPHTDTVSGNIQHKTAQKKFGTTSIYFDGTEDFLTWPDAAEWTLSGDFTISCWVYVGDLSGAVDVLSHWRGGGAGDRAFEFGLDVSEKVRFYAMGPPTVDLTSLTAVTQNTWTHIEVGRTGNTFIVFVSGVSDNSKTVVTTINNSTEDLCMGGYKENGTVGYDFVGYMDELYFNAGAVLHTDTFTVPTGAYCD